MSRKICLGKIIAAHGVKGEVKIKSYTEKEEDIFKFTELKDVKNNIFKLKTILFHFYLVPNLVILSVA